MVAGRTGWDYYVSVESRDEDSTRLETTVTTRVWEPKNFKRYNNDSLNEQPGSALGVHENVLFQAPA